MLMLIVCFSIFSCMDFLPFYKYDADIEFVTTTLSITEESSETYKIIENHPWYESSSICHFDGISMYFDPGYSSSGRPPVFGNNTVFSEQTSINNLSEYLMTFLAHFSINGSGTIDSTDIPGIEIMPFITDYNSELTSTAAVPYPADIHDISIAGSLDVSLFPTPGNLSVVNFSTTSIDPFMSGEGVMIMHSGFPNGILYFYFRHDTGYSTLFYQRNGSSSSIGSFWGAMEVEYTWFYFPH